MNKYLSIDVGTTCCKCQLFDKKGNILEHLSEEYDFKIVDEERYVDVDKITNTIFEMIKTIAKKHIISSLSFSTIGESFVSLDKNDNIIFYPMIYSDKRGDKEANYIASLFDQKEFVNKTGCLPHAMFSVSKLLYIKNNYPEIYKRIDKVLLMLDYLNYIFTGKRIIEHSLAARTGIYNINNLEIDEEICKKLDIDKKLFSISKTAGYNLGFIKEEIKKKLEIDYDIQVILGSHDQLCNAIGSGVIKPGFATDGMGTVECVTLVFDKIDNCYELGKLGLPIIPFLGKDKYCTYIVNYANNSITNWFKNEISHNFKDNYNDFFEYMENMMSNDINSIYVLPYFSGAMVPYNNINAKGAIINLTTTTKDYEIYKSILEGLTMEMYFEISQGRKYGFKIKYLVATGGGSLSKKRLQLKADMQNVKVVTLKSQEGGLLGLGIIQAVALNDYENLEQAIKKMVMIKEEYKPNKEKHILLLKKYQKYKKIYKNIKELY